MNWTPSSASHVFDWSGSALAPFRYSGDPVFVAVGGRVPGRCFEVGIQSFEPSKRRLSRNCAGAEPGRACVDTYKNPLSESPKYKNSFRSL
jgi:hypothetical protein